MLKVHQYMNLAGLVVDHVMPKKKDLIRYQQILSPLDLLYIIQLKYTLKESARFQFPKSKSTTQVLGDAPPPIFTPTFPSYYFIIYFFNYILTYSTLKKITINAKQTIHKKYIYLVFLLYQWYIFFYA